MPLIQDVQKTLPIFEDLFGMTLDISLDKFDAYLLDYNSIFGDGSGLLTLDDILRCTISRLSYEVPGDNSCVYAGRRKFIFVK
jgi:hypothetical protein